MEKVKALPDGRVVDRWGVVWEVPQMMTPVGFDRCECQVDVLVVDTVIGGTVRLNDTGRLHRCPLRAKRTR
jgi:hypothetical protein